MSNPNRDVVANGIKKEFETKKWTTPLKITLVLQYTFHYNFHIKVKIFSHTLYM